MQGWIAISKTTIIFRVLNPFMIRHKLLLPLLFLSITCCAQLSGKVVKVADGDTFTMLVKGKKQIKVRLYGIDCPERKQDFGQVAKKFLSDKIFDKTVSVKKIRTDRYGRTIGIVTIDDQNINEALLSSGLAWHYKAYDNNEDWAQLEKKARDEKKGLWSRKDSMEPWLFRKSK